MLRYDALDETFEQKINYHTVIESHKKEFKLFVDLLIDKLEKIVSSTEKKQKLLSRETVNVLMCSSLSWQLVLLYVFSVFPVSFV